MKKSSSVARSLILALLFITLVAGGLYWYKFMPQKSTSTVAENWKTYTNKVGFSLRYPPTTEINSETKSAIMPVLLVDSQNITDIPEDLPMNRGRNSILSDKQALEKGQPGETFDFLVDGSQQILPLADTYLKKYTTLAQFEICSVMFTQTALFYKNNYQIKISLVAPKDVLLSDARAYLTPDTANCSGAPRWKENNTFYSDLVAHKGPPITQEWFDEFNQIVGSIHLTE